MSERGSAADQADAGRPAEQETHDVPVLAARAGLAVPHLEGA